MLEGAFQSALSKEEYTLIGNCSKELEARSALNRYRTINQIHDPAHYPKDQLLHLSFLILFVVIETVFNAAFYEGASGLIGGAVVALSVSVANMFIAAGLGWTYRYVNLPFTKDKATGYAGLIAFIVLAFVLNLIFATFRVQYELLQAELLQNNLASATPAMLINALADEKVSLLSFKLQAIQKKINELIQEEFQKYLSYIVERANEALQTQGHNHAQGLGLSK